MSDKGKYYFDGKTRPIPNHTREHEVGRVTMQAYADYVNGNIGMTDMVERIQIIIGVTAP